MSEPKEPRLTKRQRGRQQSAAARANNQQSSEPQRDLKRLGLLGLIGAGSLALLAGGSYLGLQYISGDPEVRAQADELESRRKASGRTYAGGVNAVRGEKFLDSYSLAEQIRALEKTKHPLLLKLTRDLNHLLAPSRHPELPGWVSDKVSPLPILENSSTTSMVVYDIPNSPTEKTYAVLPNGIGLASPTAESMDYAISLARDRSVRTTSPLTQGIFLAKETYSLALVLGYGRDYHKITEANKAAIFTDVNRAPLKTEAEKEKSGLSLFDNVSGDVTGDTISVIDGLPILLLAPIVNELRLKGMFSKSDLDILGAFADANGVINRGAAKNLGPSVTNFNQRYVSGISFIPSTELLIESSRGNLVEGAREVHQQTLRPKK